MRVCCYGCDSDEAVLRWVLLKIGEGQVGGYFQHCNIQQASQYKVRSACMPESDHSSAHDRGLKVSLRSEQCCLPYTYPRSLSHTHLCQRSQKTDCLIGVVEKLLRTKTSHGIVPKNGGVTCVMGYSSSEVLISKLTMQQLLNTCLHGSRPFSPSPAFFVEALTSGTLSSSSSCSQPASRPPSRGVLSPCPP